ncbi:MAG: hypothetical protein WC959_08540 [Kiritimatiellales bacterium]
MSIKKCVLSVVSGLFCCGAVQALGIEIGARASAPVPEKNFPPTLSFYASFDDGLDAEFSRSEGGAGGYNAEVAPGGITNGAMTIVSKGGHLSFRGDHNVNTENGTITFWCKGSAIAGAEGDAWLWQVRTTGNHFIGIRRNGSALALVFSSYQGTKPNYPDISILNWDKGAFNADVWYRITASWDAQLDKGWLDVNGQMVEGTFNMPDHPGAALIFYVGGGAAGRQVTGGLLNEDNRFDEIAIYDRSLKNLYENNSLSEDEADLIRWVEAGVRNNLREIAKLQNLGGWMPVYTWPSCIGATSQGRDQVVNRDLISLNKQIGTSRVAGQFLYAYDVLRDPVYLDIAIKTGEMLIDAQFTDEYEGHNGGYWVSDYIVTPRGVERAPGAGVLLQDGVQSDQLGLLMALYKVTGDIRYKNAAVKNGEFFMDYQNPDGSWSSAVDLENGIGITTRRDPQGGEINDNAMNFAMDVMLSLWHFSNEPRFMEAYKKAADWFVDALIENEHVCGWALQYDNQKNPVWARDFEPPALSYDAIPMAAKALIEAYRLSGDDRYLEPIRKTSTWLKTTFPDGKMYYYYDIASGRPLTAYKNQIYFLDDPEQMALAQTFPISAAMTAIHDCPDLDSMLAKANTAGIDNDSAISTGNLKTQAISSLSRQSEDGMWLYIVGSGNYVFGNGFAAYRILLLRYLAYIERIDPRVPAELRHLGGDGDLLKMAAPGNWYDVQWPTE